MKKILAILLLSFTLLFAGRATWTVDFYDANFQKVWSESVNVEYAGQNVTIAIIKSVTANKLSVTYTDSDTTNGVRTFYGIDAKPVFNSSAVWAEINMPISLTVTE